MSGSGSGSSNAVDRAQAHREQIAQVLVALYDGAVAGEYTGSPIHGAADTDELFDERITFRDPLMKVVGIQNYRAQFASLHQLFHKITMQVHSISWGHGSGKLTDSADVVPPPSRLPSSSDPDVVTIDALCTYEYNKWIKITIRQITTARISKEPSGMGKIIAHEDMWSLADLYERIPLVGPLYRFVQPLAGSLFSRIVLIMYGRRAGVPSSGEGVHHLNTNTLHAAYRPIESEQIGAKSLHSMARARGKKEQAHSGEKKEL